MNEVRYLGTELGGWRGDLEEEVGVVDLEGLPGIWGLLQDGG